MRPVASTLLTPLTLWATWIARFFSMLLPTLPVRRTMPSVVSTEMSVAWMSLVVANSDFTLVVIQASSTLPGTVWLADCMLPLDCASASCAKACANGTAANAAARPAAARVRWNAEWVRMALSFVWLSQDDAFAPYGHGNRALVHEACVGRRLFSANYPCARLAEGEVGAVRKGSEWRVAGRPAMEYMHCNEV